MSEDSRDEDSAMITGKRETKSGGNPEPPHEVDGDCSRCGGRWPCLRCLTSTPPFVRVHNNF